MIQREDDKK